MDRRLDIRRRAGRAASVLRFGLSVRRYVRERMTLEEAQAKVAQRMPRREERFLSMVQRAVLSNAKSPYRKMLAEAGMDYGRLQGLVREHGLEGALEELRQRGVFVAYEDFKAIDAHGRSDSEKFDRGVSFDNPFTGPGFSTRSSGTRSAGSRLVLDFASQREMSAHWLLQSAEFGMLNAVKARYFPILPSGAGIGAVLRANYMRERLEAWFTPLDPRGAPWVHRLQTGLVTGALRLAGGTAPRPQYVALSRPAPIARWLAERGQKGQMCALYGYASSVVRVCLAAKEEGLELSGARFCLQGEPVTEAKREAVRAIGAVPVVVYSAMETGPLGSTCRESQGPDDMHFFTDSFAMIQHTRPVGPDGTPARPFLLTSLLAEAPKILLNVEIDDCGEVSERPCGCFWGRLGLTKRVRNVRSFVKLTTEGMTFVGTDLVQVIEGELPQRFGGGPSDYQLLEEEDAQGRGRLSLRVSPKVGPVDDRDIVEHLYDRIRSGGAAARLFGDMWREAQSIHVVREEPQATRGGKILPFHTLR